MSTTVFITFPDNRRKSYKVTPVMTLQTLLANACKDAKISKPEIYTLKDNRKELDLTLPFRFTNLAPGAKLTLVKSNKPSKKASKVLIALQMPEGGRLNDEFLTTTTLWELLLHFEQRSKGALNLTKKVEKESSPKNTFKKLIKSDKYVYLQPVCIVLNKEYGTIEDLKKTTLKSAGINEDVMIRMLFKFTDKSLNDVLPLIEANMSNSDDTCEIPKKEPPKDPNEGQINILSSSSSLKSEESKQIISTNTSSLESNNTDNGNIENENKKIKIQNNNEQVQNSVQQPIQQSISQNIIEKMNIPSISSVKDDTSKSKSNIDLNSINENEIIEGKIDRNIKFYNPPKDNVNQSNRIELPDSFFELSQFEMRLLISQQTKKQKELENMPLKTKAMREQEDEQKRKKYPKCLIRVKFPNRMIVELTFLSNELVSDLYKEIKEVLYTKEKPFYLYTTPPKVVLSDQSQTLWKAGLVPSSNVHFNWSNEKDKEAVKVFLAPEFEKQLKDLVIEDVPIKIPVQDSNSSGRTLSDNSSGRTLNNSNNYRPSSSGIRLGSNDANNKGKSKMNMPKWFKLQ